MCPGEQSWVGGDEEAVGDIASQAETGQALGVTFHFVFRKNEAMIGWIPRNSFVFVVFEHAGRVLQIYLLSFTALCLEGAELLERLLELAGEALAVNAEGGERLDHELGIRGVFEQLRFDQRDAVLSPGEVGKLVDELRLGGRGGAELVEELLDVAVEGGQVFGREDGGLGG